MSDPTAASSPSSASRVTRSAPVNTAGWSKSANRSLLLAWLIPAANLVVNFLEAYLLRGATSPVLTWIGMIVHTLVIGALCVEAIRYGRAGLRETAGDAMSGRGRAKAGIGLSIAFVTLTLGLTIMNLVLAAQR
ncbi:hypothetical protein N1027_09685 [Herbiconiux sp. CPCC 205763]|uniref:Uncharacterized protein n=1 Tax=Herbiconiux aconitum TaxID=2970913 RepID=A0ABT2GQB2_9MICO|nr:hypothetical protein [Herbiconiux aconitum]MCS5718407.1 hypothetical protein [Herbiconiux aconitum]